MTRGARAGRIARAVGGSPLVTCAGLVACGVLVACAWLGCGGVPSGARVVEVELPWGAEGDPASTEQPTLPPVRVVRLERRGSLEDLLIAELRAAEDAGERLLVMTHGERCRPCRRFIHALGDRAMREALTGAVVVRVDVARYGSELGALGLETYVTPAFFLLDERGHARDGITGSEWTDDVAANIAPVMGAFMRGQYVERKAPLPR